MSEQHNSLYELDVLSYDEFAGVIKAELNDILDAGGVGQYALVVFGLSVVDWPDEIDAKQIALESLVEVIKSGTEPWAGALLGLSREGTSADLMMWVETGELSEVDVTEEQFPADAGGILGEMNYQVLYTLTEVSKTEIQENFLAGDVDLAAGVAVGRMGKVSDEVSSGKVLVAMENMALASLVMRQTFRE